jgi:hypothetical protein
LGDLANAGVVEWRKVVSNVPDKSNRIRLIFPRSSV